MSVSFESRDNTLRRIHNDRVIYIRLVLLKNSTIKCFKININTDSQMSLTNVEIVRFLSYKETRSKKTVALSEL